MLEREFPILEFDEDRSAFIRPENIIQPVDVSERCVLCFFPEAIERILMGHPNRIAAQFTAESLEFPLYELDYKGRKVALMQAGVGAPIAAAQIEELTAFGCRKYVACGSCGVLQKEIAVGHLILPTSAVRDEGTSYHYVKPSREIQADPKAIDAIENVLLERNVPFIKGKTWTTDAFYRETAAKVRKRKEEGCITVEMEASAYMAVSQYNNVEFGQILYAGDNLGGDVWDSRNFASRVEIREYVLGLALDACLQM